MAYEPQPKNSPDEIINRIVQHVGHIVQRREEFRDDLRAFYYACEAKK